MPLETGATPPTSHLFPGRGLPSFLITGSSSGTCVNFPGSPSPPPPRSWSASSVFSLVPGQAKTQASGSSDQGLKFLSSLECQEAGRMSLLIHATRRLICPDTDTYWPIEVINSSRSYSQKYPVRSVSYMTFPAAGVRDTALCGMAGTQVLALLGCPLHASSRAMVHSPGLGQVSTSPDQPNHASSFLSKALFLQRAHLHRDAGIDSCL